MLTITDKAKQRVLEAVQAEGKSDLGLRVSIDGRSPAGLQFGLALITPDEVQEDDVVVDGGGLAVLDLAGVDDARAEGLRHALMAEADAEDGHLAREALDQLDADAGVVRGFGAGGDDDALGGELGDFVEGDLVVAVDDDVGSQFAEVLVEVVGEGVVVIEEEDHTFVPARPP